METSKRRAASCDCGVCRKCKTRKYMAARRLDPEYAAYMRNYRARNRERLRLQKAAWDAKNLNHRQSYRREFYTARIEEARDYSKRYYWSLSDDERKAKCLSKVGYRRQWYISNREHVRQQSAQYSADHSAEAIARAKAWSKANPERRAVIARKAEHKRRALIAGVGGVVTESQLRALFSRQQGKCMGCRKRVGGFDTGNWHHDHVMPITRGGPNTIENAQILCPACNKKKQAKHPDQWAQELGRLFA